MLSGCGNTTILLVDDDPGDQELTRRALFECVPHADLRVACDGEEALEYLLHTGRYADAQTAPRPHLILLDLNMPRMGGIEVLGRLRAEPTVQRIPVIVLSTSAYEEDILRSYGLGCNSFITKPVDIDAFVKCVGQLSAYWLELVQLPAE